MISREEIKTRLSELNSVENQRHVEGVEWTINGIYQILDDNWEGWFNGEHTPNSDVQREKERHFFTMFPDYNRTFDKIIIDPPLASVLWSITATDATNNHKVNMHGISIIEFNDKGRVIKSWLYADQMPKSAALEK
jgi:hypothetical protein